MPDDRFPIRLALPVDLLKEMNGLLASGRTPYDTQDEFVAEAVRQLLFQIRHGDAGIDAMSVDDDAALYLFQAKHHAARPTDEREPADPVAFAREHGIDFVHDARATAIDPPERGVPMRAGRKLPVSDGPLFGLHVRDYPSTWALCKLAEWAQDGPMPFPEYRRLIGVEASRLATAVWPLDEQRPTGKARIAAGFPKAGTDAGGPFIQGSVGSLHRSRTTGMDTLHGPLFVWRVAALDAASNDANIGVTARGWDLLGRLEGMTIDTPHEPRHARAFTRHLADHAPGDAAALGLLLRLAGEARSREQIETRFRRVFKTSAGVARTNVQGYVGRAREWGLIEEGRGNYALTAVGDEVAATLRA